MVCCGCGGLRFVDDVGGIFSVGLSRLLIEAHRSITLNQPLLHVILKLDLPVESFPAQDAILTKGYKAVSYVRRSRASRTSVDMPNTFNCFDV